VPPGGARPTAADSRAGAIRAIQNQARERAREEEEANEARRHLPNLLFTTTAFDLVKAKVGAGTDKRSEQVRKHAGIKAFKGEGLPHGMTLKKIDANLQVGALKSRLGNGAGQWSWETFAKEMNQPSTEDIKKFRDACIS
jgi:hypothetical protein